MLDFKLNGEAYKIRRGDYVSIWFHAEDFEYYVEFKTAKGEPLCVEKPVRLDYLYSEFLTFREYFDGNYEQNLKHLLGGIVLEHYEHPQHFKLTYRIVKVPR